MPAPLETEEGHPHPRQVGRGHRAAALPRRAGDHRRRCGCGDLRREPVAGQRRQVSGRVNRRRTSSCGVGRTSPNPSAVRGRTRLPNHDGGAAPMMGRSLMRGTFGFRVLAGLVGDALGSVVVEGWVPGDAAFGCAPWPAPHAVSARRPAASARPVRGVLAVRVTSDSRTPAARRRAPAGAAVPARATAGPGCGTPAPGCRPRRARRERPRSSPPSRCCPGAS